MFKTPVIAAVATLAAIVTTAATAEPKAHAWPVGDDSIHLYYPDLDMNSVAGREVLLARIEPAAAELCREQIDPRGCIADTVAQTTRLPAAGPIRLALAERDGRMQLAAH